jgi:hypothetical protein
MNFSAERVAMSVDAKRTAPLPSVFERPTRIFPGIQSDRLTLRSATGFALAALLLHCGHSFSQTGMQNHPVRQVQRDKRGVAAITRALNAMGGETAFAALNDTKTEASCTRISNTKSDTHTIRWVTADDYFRYDGGDKDHRGMVNGPRGLPAWSGMLT